MPTEPHPLDYGRPEPRRRPFLARPFYRDYVVAYVLIGAGGKLFDKACVPPENLPLQIFGATLFLAGLLIFVIAIAYLIWSVVASIHASNRPIKLMSSHSSGATSREIPISLASQADCHAIERSIDRAIDDSGLNVTLRGSLRKFPGSTHWHLKRGRETGTLEITFWPQERRAWFTIQSGRRAAWIEEQLQLLHNAIRRQYCEK